MTYSIRHIQRGLTLEYQDEVLTDSTIRKDSWNSVEEALRKAECIRQEDGEAFFADNGHAGMIKKGYVDPYFPQKSKGRIWRIK